MRANLLDADEPGRRDKGVHRAKGIGFFGRERLGKRSVKALGQPALDTSPAFGNPAKSPVSQFQNGNAKLLDPCRLCGPRSHEVCLYRFRLILQITAGLDSGRPHVQT